MHSAERGSVGLVGALGFVWWGFEIDGEVVQMFWSGR